MRTRPLYTGLHAQLWRFVNPLSVKVIDRGQYTFMKIRLAELANDRVTQPHRT